MSGVVRFRFAVATVALGVAACGGETRRTDSVAGDTQSTRAPGGDAQSTRASSPTAPSVTPLGIGPLRTGMTVAEARAALPKFELPRGADATGCSYAVVGGLPVGVGVMVENGRVVRVDVDSGSAATAEGARVGDQEAKVQSLYGSRVTISPSKYSDGHYLTVRSATPGDTIHRIVFETDKARVKAFRAGQLPQVGYVEKCG